MQSRVSVPAGYPLVQICNGTAEDTLSQVATTPARSGRHLGPTSREFSYLQPNRCLEKFGQSG